MSDDVKNRLFLDLCHGAADAETLRAAAEFARLLSLDLHCLFIEDESLLALAEFPFAREIRLPNLQWTSLDSGTLSTELRDLAAQTRRRLEQVLKDAGLQSRFEVLRGDPAVCIGGVCRVGDVVILTESSSPGAHKAHGAARLHRAARASAASVLLLPPRHRMRSGSVTVVMADADDDSLDIACRIAVATNETVTVLLPDDTAAASEATLVDRALRSGLPRDRLSIRRLHGKSSHDVSRAIGISPVRLVVLKHSLSASGFDDVAAILADLRDVPVLLLDGEPGGN